VFSATFAGVLTGVAKVLKNRILRKANPDQNAPPIKANPSQSVRVTSTIWDDIVPTANNMPYTKIPATFQINLDRSIKYINPQTGTNTLWTNANATKHMREYIVRLGGETPSTGLRSQIMLKSYSASLNQAMADISKKPPGRYFGKYGNWELGINTETGVVYHALMIK
jgi:hypothetical protein